MGIRVFNQKINNTIDEIKKNISDIRQIEAQYRYEWLD